jgi:hypothetical protein
VKICNTGTAVPLGARRTVSGEMILVGPPVTKGTIELVSEMVPLNPPTLESVTLTRPIEPRRMVREFGFVVILKSGTAT